MFLKMYSKHLIFAGSMLAIVVGFTRCSANNVAGGVANLTTAGKITSGLGSATETMQGLGGALASGSSSFSTGSNVITSAATSCTVHGDPGEDTNLNGTVEDGEKFNSTHSEYALTKFYCAMAADSDGPETVSGSLRLIKTVTCAIEKQLGSITFDGNAVAASSLTITTDCATADMLQDMNNGTPTSSVTISLPITITAALNPTFSEFPSNSHYSHGIRIASNDGTSLKFIILAKFDDSVAGDPIENGDFEFATYGTGSVMQGTGAEYTAGKLDRTTSTSGTLWYESRINRIKTDPDGGGPLTAIDDPLCKPGEASSSCGFARHMRLRTEIEFSSGDISNITNFTGIASEGYDPSGSGMMGDGAYIITATGSLASGITAKAWTADQSAVVGPDNGYSPEDFTTGDNLANATVFPAPNVVTSCITGGGAISTSCGTAPSPLEPSGDVGSFFMPANTTAWLHTISQNGGIGFTGAASLADVQHP